VDPEILIECADQVRNLDKTLMAARKEHRMTKLTRFAFVVVAAVALPTAMAFGKPLVVRPVQGPALEPIPETQAAGPMPAVGAQPIPATAAVVPLYHNVRYKDRKNIAPCAVPQIVMVKDPCPPACDPCNPCAIPPVQCVAVEICVPPCSPCPPKVTCRRGGEYVKYDFGKYRVEIRSRRGRVTVDYDA
jgi:hypothetical protein